MNDSKTRDNKLINLETRGLDVESLTGLTPVMHVMVAVLEASTNSYRLSGLYQAPWKISHTLRGPKIDSYQLKSPIQIYLRKVVLT